MGNLHIRKLMKPKRLFAAKKSDHRHDYSIPVLVEINSLDNFNNIFSKAYYQGRKCRYCQAMMLDNYLKEPNWNQPVIRLKTRHTHRIDLTDLELM